MKNIYILFIFLLFGFNDYANPIALPTIEISELYFDESDNWQLELAYYDVNQPEFSIDSIFLYSNSNSIKLPSYELIGNNGVFVITQDSLDSKFTINSYSESLKVVSFSMEQAFKDELNYGNFYGAPISYPRKGQSLSRYYSFFLKDKSPTIGEPNDTTGTCGTVKGILYDKYSEPVKNRKFILDTEFETSAKGEYETRAYSKPSNFKQITHITGRHSYQFVPITEISYIMEPDSVIERDLYLLDSLVSGINESKLNNNPVKIYPNPVAVTEKLSVDVDLPVVTSDVWMEILDINGKLIRKMKIGQKESTVNLPEKTGLYIVIISLDTEIISSKRIVVNE
jgi:hypothetical protein